MKINILALAVIISVSATADAQYIADPYLYYSVGGGRATTPTIIDPSVRFGFRASSSGFACGNFDPKLDIRSMLGGVGNSMADLGSLQSSLTGALPGQILCRAQPFTVSADAALHREGGRPMEVLDRFLRTAAANVRWRTECQLRLAGAWQGTDLGKTGPDRCFRCRLDPTESQ